MVPADPIEPESNGILKSLSLKTLRMDHFFPLGQNLGVQDVSRPRMKQQGEGKEGRTDK